MTFRRARIGEHLALTELALRSVQECWQYSDDFMAWEPEAIMVAPEHISDGITVILEHEDKLLGFCVLRGTPPELEMSRLMVAPGAIGMGCGRRLWDHAVETASSLGVVTITLDADPNAEPFYHRMGARTAGEHDWEPPMMSGWRVKKMRYVIRPLD